MNETDLSVEQSFKVEEIILHDGFDNSDGDFNNDIGTNTSSDASVLMM